MKKAKLAAKPESAEEVLRAVADAAARLAESDDGKILLRYLREKVAERSTFVPGDPYATHLKEGMRVLYLHICYLAKLGSEGVSKLFTASAPTSIWEQTRDILHVEEELNGTD